MAVMTTLSEHFGFVPDYYTAFLRMSHGVVDKVCGHCGLRDDQLKMCSMCRAAWYCNEEHQREDWQQHKPFCITKSASLRLAATGAGGAGIGVASGGGASAKNRKKAKKKSPETNFNMDKTVLDEVAVSQQYHQQYQDQAAAMSPNEMQFQGGGGLGRGRRKSPITDLSTPIDSGHHPLEASSQVCQSKTPPLYHVTDSVDTHSLEEAGFGQDWFASVLHLIMGDLNKYGVCVVDDFLGEWPSVGCLLYVGLYIWLCMSTIQFHKLQ